VEDVEEEWDRGEEREREEEWERERERDSSRERERSRDRSREREREGGPGRPSRAHPRSSLANSAYTTSPARHLSQVGSAAHQTALTSVYCLLTFD
jgi:hypothetical protein